MWYLKKKKEKKKIFSPYLWSNVKVEELMTSANTVDI